MTSALVLAEAVALALAAWAGVKLYKGRGGGKTVAAPIFYAGATLLAIAMLAAFGLPFAAGQPSSLWWIPPCLVAAVVLDGTRRRRAIRRGPVSFAAWMLLTAGVVELVFWLGEQVLRSD